jgi:hypothetical protein
VSVAVHSLGVLSTAVHVLDPVEHIPLVLVAGDQITDPANAEQISNPPCWTGNQVPTTETAAPTTVRKAKPAQG